MPAALALLAVLTAPGCKGSRSRVPSDSRCIAAESDAPLVVAWPDRASLSRAIGDTPVVVRSVGCDLEILPSCRSAKADPYLFVASPPTRDVVRLSGQQQVFRKLSPGAPDTWSRLSGADLEVRTTIAGAWRSDRNAPKRADLEGDCADATHVVSGILVGGFKLTSVAPSEDPSRGTEFASAGKLEACSSSTQHDQKPNPDCDEPVRIELVPIREEPGAASARPSDEPGSKAPKTVLSVTLAAGLAAAAYGGYRVVTSRSTMDDHCIDKACDQEGLDAADAGRKGAWMLDIGLLVAAGSVVLLGVIPDRSNSYSSLPSRTRVASEIPARKARAPLPDKPKLLLGPSVTPNGVSLGLGGRF